MDRRKTSNNCQPRIGFAWDVRGDGKDVIRGGWGIYHDMGYTNSNVLFPAVDATGIGFGRGLQRGQPGRHPQSGRQLLPRRAADLEHRGPEPGGPGRAAAFGQWLDPRLELPYTRQTAFGWSHELMTNTVFTADFVRNDGRDLNVRPRLNTRPISSRRRRRAGSRSSA